jgi:pimeloyl-ACP methyl ester carboxylesterase
MQPEAVSAKARAHQRHLEIDMSTHRMAQVTIGRPEGLYRMVYREWGALDAPRTLVCVHGLTRNSLDFAPLARALGPGWRVVAPDVIGRGESDWLRDPQGYQLPLYVQDMLVLLARLNVETVDWVGTSMGGLIGMLLAGLPGSPIRRLVLNDVGPLLPAAALQRIGTYVGQPLPDASRAGAEAYLRMISSPFGPHSEADWAELCDALLRPDGEGGWRLNYDPGIAVPFRTVLAGEDVVLWPHYDAITCPTLLLRGELSDLLTAELAAEMAARGPRPQCLVFPGVGHAPTLRAADQQAAVRDFLLAG